MFFVKRAWYYFSRKLSKVITIGIILFIVSVLVLTGLVIESASSSAAEVAKNKLGSSINYTTDMASIMPSREENEEGVQPERGSGGGFNLEIPNDYSGITTKEVELISNNSKYVKSYTINASLSGNAVDFSYYDPFSSSNESSNEQFPNKGMNKTTNINITGLDKEENNSLFDVSTITSGRYFTDSEIENSSNVIIIESTIASINSLSVGDNVTISKSERMGKRPDEESNDDEAVEITYEIVGVYKTEESTNITQGFGMNISENTMYTPYTSILATNLLGLEGDELEEAKTKIEENGYEVSSATFNLKDPEDSDLFIKEVEKMEGIDLTYRSLGIDNSAYEKMTDSITNVSNTSKILVVVVIIAGVFIIGLLSMLSIKDRKYELGVLLSLGESKFKIICQLILEMIMVALIAFSLAIVTSNFTAQATTNYLLNQELSEKEITDNGDRNNQFGGNMMGPNNNQLKNMDVETIEELTVSVNPVNILQMVVIGILVIIIGNSIQALFVLKANPKEIMLER